MAVLTIFWTALADANRAVLDGALRTYDAHVVRVNPELLARHTLAAVARGPVICVVGTDREAGHALSLGVDEILRAGEVTTEVMAEAVMRARARAAVRASREYRHALLDEDDETALAVLGGALGERLEMPLAMASLDCASVADAMNCLIELDNQFFAWTALVAPSDQLRSLIARRLTAPTAPELKGVLRRLRASIGRAESLVRLLRELTDPKGSRGPLFVATLLADIVDVMRPVIEPGVEISVEAAAECVTTASRTTLVVIVGALLSNALDGIRAASRGKGKISVLVFEAEDANRRGGPRRRPRKFPPISDRISWGAAIRARCPAPGASRPPRPRATRRGRSARRFGPHRQRDSSVSSLGEGSPRRDRGAGGIGGIGPSVDSKFEKLEQPSRAAGCATLRGQLRSCQRMSSRPL